MANSRFIVGIFGGIGAGKKSLAEQLPAHFTHRQNREIDILPVRFSKNSPNIDYKVYIDRPLDVLLEKYVNSLPVRELIDKPLLAEKMREFRDFHQKSVICHRISADFYLSNVENDARIHMLSLEIVKKWRKSLWKEEDESEDVKMYLEQRITRRSHPSIVLPKNREIF